MLYAFNNTHRRISYPKSQKVPWIMPFNSAVLYTKALHKKIQRLVTDHQILKNTYDPHILQNFMNYTSRKNIQQTY
jgi:hypothetical protein